MNKRIIIEIQNQDKLATLIDTLFSLGKTSANGAAFRLQAALDFAKDTNQSNAFVVLSRKTEDEFFSDIFKAAAIMRQDKKISVSKELKSIIKFKADRKGTKVHDQLVSWLHTGFVQLEDISEEFFSKDYYVDMHLMELFHELGGTVKSINRRFKIDQITTFWGFINQSKTFTRSRKIQ